MEVQLTIQEAQGTLQPQNSLLPTVCMRCGAQAVRVVPGSGSSVPGTASNGGAPAGGTRTLLDLLFIVLDGIALLGIRRDRRQALVGIHLCEKHWRIWTRGDRWEQIAKGCLLASCSLLLAWFGCCLWPSNRSRPGVKWLGVVSAILTAAAVVGGLIVAVVVAATRVRVTRTTDTHVTLAGISPDFAEAFRLHQQLRADERARWLEEYRCKHSS